MHVKRVLRRSLLMGSALATLALAVPTMAQAQAVPGGPPAVFQAVDDNGVDLTNGGLVLADLQASVGQPGEGGLSRRFVASGLRDNLVGTINSDTDELGRPVRRVSLGGAAATFLEDSGALIPYAGAEGQTLVHDSGAGTFTYTAADGSVAVFSEAFKSFSKVQADTALVTSVTKPSGERLTYAYQPGCSGECRLEAVTNNLGYMMKYEYDAAAPLKLTRVTAINLAVEYCAPTAASCSATSWTSTAFSGPDTGFGSVQATDSLGRTMTYTYDNGRVTNIALPTGNGVAIGYLASGEVHTVTTAAGTWTYDYAALPVNPVTHVPDRQVTVTDPLGHARVYVVDGFWNRVTSSRDALSRTTSVRLDPNGRISRMTLPEGDYVDYGYDPRGNLQSVTRVPKPGSSLPSRTTTYSYDATCTNPKTCNRPNYVIDAGARTDFTYDAAHGGVLTVTGPAGANGVRPQTRYAYAPLTAWYFSAPGVLSAAPTPVYKQTGISTCLTLASCTGTADEAKTTFTRGTAGVANNLQVTTATRSDGTGALSSVTSLAYNRFGDLRTIDGPLAGTGDTVRLRYDEMRQLVGRIEADPDGQGTGRPAAATKWFYTPDGQVSSIQHGSLPSQSDADWANSFTRLYTKAYIRDGVGRTVQARLVDQAGAVQALTQHGFSGHRLDCVAVRMNPAAFASPPASACSLGPAGSAGPDRVNQYAYSNADELVGVTEALGTAQARTRAVTFSPNGQMLTMRDGKNALTTFEYDGHDRLSKIRFPGAADGTVSSTTDYLQLTYDEPTWDVVGERRRDGQTVTYAYDARHRATSKSAPGPTTYGYDNLDRMTSASAGGQTLTTTYDALGRQTGTSGWFGTVANQYDAADRRTRLTWPNGAFVTYDYDTAGAMTAIRESGATALVTYGYDGFGRRTSLTRSNGTSTGYGYDSLSRLTSLSLDLAGTANDLSRTFTYSPANELLTRNNSNAIYGLRNRANGRTHTLNGLNQVTVANGAAQAYDGRGNQTSDGSTAFGYDLDNRLTSVGGLALAYDPIGRLHQTTVGGVSTRFVYDGWAPIAEYDAGGTLQQRYVHGPLPDEPLVADAAGTKSWLVADERGSVVALTNAAGTSTATNIFDEFGVPGTNQGRFQYTGQMQLPGVLVHHYKHRAYAPVTTRFLQADPIGVGGGANLYAYAGNDPIGRRDPMGLEIEGVTVTGRPDRPIEMLPPPMPTGGGGGGGGAGLAGQAFTPPTQRNPNEAVHLHRSEDDEAWESDEITVQPERQLAQRLTPPMELLVRPPVMFRPPTIPFPRSITEPPGTGWIWRGPPGASVGGPKGNWYNPKTGESLHPDMNHGEPIGPHWDYKAPGQPWMRWFPNGTLAPKGIVLEA